MSSALEQIDYTVVNGEKSEPLLTIFALSTCAFCKKAMNYLEEHGFGYRYCYLDQLDFDLKREAKKAIKLKFKSVPVFPVLTIDNEDVLSGFIEQKWAERLGIG